ncbi:histidine kinase [Nonomuraea sp. NPDC050310]|uniref:sensor histidine kinase n=1 Tax=unclassified Nonomuraea TaxID=2593643 RepID=UPI00340E097C
MRREALYALGCFAVGCVLIAGGASIPRDGVSDWWMLGPLAVTCVGVLIRRLSPVTAMTLGIAALTFDSVFLGPSLATALVFTDNLYAGVLYGPPRLARWMLGVTSSLAVLAGAVAVFLSGDWRMLALVGVQTALLLVTPVTTAMVLRQQRDLARAERARAEEIVHLAELDRQVAISAERRRMARELHDMIANHFSAIAIQSSAALSRKDLDAATVRKIMESVRENSLRGMTEMRAMVGLLRQDGDDSEEVTRPRLQEAPRLLERVRQAGLEGSVLVEGDAREIPVSVDMAGYRIVQEALTNALKHGDGQVSVRIGYETERVSLVIDNPVRDSRTTLPGSGTGLIGMRERALLVGGEFEAGPYDGGWRVRAVLPAAGSGLQRLVEEGAR